MPNGLDINIPILPMLRFEAAIYYSMFSPVKFDDELREGSQAHRSRRFRPEWTAYSLDQTVEAYRHMLGNAQCGNIIVQASDH